MKAKWLAFPLHMWVDTEFKSWLGEDIWLNFSVVFLSMQVITRIVPAIRSWPLPFIFFPVCYLLVASHLMVYSELFTVSLNKSHMNTSIRFYLLFLRGVQTTLFCDRTWHQILWLLIWAGPVAMHVWSKAFTVTVINKIFSGYKPCWLVERNWCVRGKDSSSNVGSV